MKHQSGPEEAPPPPSPVAGWASGFFRAILSILATAEEDYAEADVTVHAAPGLATLLDIAMYRSREAELTSVTFDGRSNVLSEGAATFTYNTEGNRLLSVSWPGGPTLDYAYDEAGYTDDVRPHLASFRERFPFTMVNG